MSATPSLYTEHLDDPLAEPVEPALLGSLRQPRPGDEDIVAALLGPRLERPPRFPQLPLHAVADDGAPDRPRHREAEPRIAVALLTGERVERQEARRGRAAAPVDRVEVPRPREAMAALHRPR